MGANIGGSQLKDKNVWLRMFLFVFAGIMTLAVLISWRSQLISASEYVEFPTKRVNKVDKKPQMLKATEILKTEIEVSQ